MEVQPLASGRSGTVTGEVSFFFFFLVPVYEIQLSYYKFIPDLFAPWSIWKTEQSRHIDSPK